VRQTYLVFSYYIIISYCLDTLNRLMLEEKIEKSGPGIIVLDDATLLRGNSASGIVFITSDGSSVIIALYPNIAKSSEDLAKQTFQTLQELSFWPVLKTKIKFLMSDSSRLVDKD